MSNRTDLDKTAAEIVRPILDGAVQLARAATDMAERLTTDLHDAYAAGQGSRDVRSRVATLAEHAAAEHADRSPVTASRCARCGRSFCPLCDDFVRAESPLEGAFECVECAMGERADECCRPHPTAPSPGLRKVAQVVATARAELAKRRPTGQDIDREAAIVALADRWLTDEALLDQVCGLLDQADELDQAVTELAQRAASYEEQPAAFFAQVSRLLELGHLPASVLEPAQAALQAATDELAGTPAPTEEQENAAAALGTGLCEAVIDPGASWWEREIATRLCRAVAIAAVALNGERADVPGALDVLRDVLDGLKIPAPEGDAPAESRPRPTGASAICSVLLRVPGVVHVTIRQPAPGEIEVFVDGGFTGSIFAALYRTVVPEVTMRGNVINNPEPGGRVAAFSRGAVEARGRIPAAEILTTGDRGPVVPAAPTAEPSERVPYLKHRKRKPHVEGVAAEPMTPDELAALRARLDGSGLGAVDVERLLANVAADSSRIVGLEAENLAVRGALRRAIAAARGARALTESQWAWEMRFLGNLEEIGRGGPPRYDDPLADEHPYTHMWRAARARALLAVGDMTAEQHVEKLRADLAESRRFNDELAAALDAARAATASLRGMAKSEWLDALARQEHNTETHAARTRDLAKALREEEGSADWVRLIRKAGMLAAGAAGELLHVTEQQNRDTHTLCCSDLSLALGGDASTECGWSSLIGRVRDLVSSERQLRQAARTPAEEWIGGSLEQGAQERRDIAVNLRALAAALDEGMAVADLAVDHETRVAAEVAAEADPTRDRVEPGSTWRLHAVVRGSAPSPRPADATSGIDDLVAAVIATTRDNSRLMAERARAQREIWRLCDRYGKIDWTGLTALDEIIRVCLSAPLRDEDLAMTAARNALATRLIDLDGEHSSALTDCCSRAAELLGELAAVREVRSLREKDLAVPVAIKTDGNLLDDLRTAVKRDTSNFSYGEDDPRRRAELLAFVDRLAAALERAQSVSVERDEEPSSEAAAAEMRTDFRRAVRDSLDKLAGADPSAPLPLPEGWSADRIARVEATWKGHPMTPGPAYVTVTANGETLDQEASRRVASRVSDGQPLSAAIDAERAPTVPAIVDRATFAPALKLWGSAPTAVEIVTHRATCADAVAYRCCGCDRTLCLECHAPVLSEEIKTIAEWCPRCETIASDEHRLPSSFWPTPEWVRDGRRGVGAGWIVSVVKRARMRLSAQGLPELSALYPGAGGAAAETVRNMVIVYLADRLREMIAEHLHLDEVSGAAPGAARAGQPPIPAPRDGVVVVYPKSVDHLYEIGEAAPHGGAAENPAPTLRYDMTLCDDGYTTIVVLGTSKDGRAIAASYDDRPAESDPEGTRLAPDEVVRRQRVAEEAVRRRLQEVDGVGELVPTLQYTERLEANGYTTTVVLGISKGGHVVADSFTDRPQENAAAVVDPDGKRPPRATDDAVAARREAARIKVLRQIAGLDDVAIAAVEMTRVEWSHMPDDVAARRAVRTGPAIEIEPLQFKALPPRPMPGAPNFDGIALPPSSVLEGPLVVNAGDAVPKVSGAGDVVPKVTGSGTGSVTITQIKVAPAAAGSSAVADSVASKLDAAERAFVASHPEMRKASAPEIRAAMFASFGDGSASPRPGSASTGMDGDMGDAELPVTKRPPLGDGRVVVRARGAVLHMDGGEVSAPVCPAPCERCRSKPIPCSCACHAAGSAPSDQGAARDRGPLPGNAGGSVRGTIEPVADVVGAIDDAVRAATPGWKWATLPAQESGDATESPAAIPRRYHADRATISYGGVKVKRFGIEGLAVDGGLAEFEVDESAAKCKMCEAPMNEIGPGLFVCSNLAIYAAELSRRGDKRPVTHELMRADGEAFLARVSSVSASASARAPESAALLAAVAGYLQAIDADDDEESGVRVGTARLDSRAAVENALEAMRRAELAVPRGVLAGLRRYVEKPLRRPPNAHHTTTGKEITEMLRRAYETEAAPEIDAAIRAYVDAPSDVTLAVMRAALAPVDPDPDTRATLLSPVWRAAMDVAAIDHGQSGEPYAVARLRNALTARGGRAGSAENQ